MQRWLRRQSTRHTRSRSFGGISADGEQSLLRIERIPSPTQIPAALNADVDAGRSEISHRANDQDDSVAGVQAGSQAQQEPNARSQVLQPEAVAISRTVSSDKTTQTPSCIPNSTHINDFNIVAELHNFIINDDANNLVKLVVGSDIDVNSTFGRSRRPILHVAASLGAHNCLCYLIRLGADVDKQDSAGGTAFHLAARNGHREVAEALVNQFGANVSIADAKGCTALHWLASNGHVERLELLFSLGPPVDFEDHNGQTALHAASRGGHTHCVNYLLWVHTQCDYFPRFFWVDVRLSEPTLVEQSVSRGESFRPACLPLISTYAPRNRYIQVGEGPCIQAPFTIRHT
eukprot:m.739161 g.739161  ORF g.739161 m.739161 type:complete len:347 (-) comp23102_c1_seq7:3-1043(-)